MKFLKFGVGALLALVLLVFVVGLFLPSTYHVERSIEIQASPEIVHALVGDLEQWDRWTPWKEMDPTVDVTFGPKTTGVGASQTWTGKDGGGALTFTTCSLQEGIAYDMSFDRGSYVSKTKMRYKISGASTEVAWIMDGEVGINPIDRMFSMLMDSFVGPAFDTGLKKLKVVAEEEAAKAEQEMMQAPAEGEAAVGGEMAGADSAS